MVSGANPWVDKDLFVAKYDATGRLLWVHRAGGRGSDVAYGIALDSFGQVFLTGSFYGDAYFGRINLSGDGLSTTFVTKLGWQ